MKATKVMAVAAIVCIASAAVGAQPCAENATVEQPTGLGPTFRTWQEFWNVKPELAFTRLTTALANDGYAIVNSDRSTGVISATQGVIGNSAARIPYNAVVAQEGSGSKVSLKFSPGAGMVLNQSDVVKQFCKTLGVVDQ